MNHKYLVAHDFGRTSGLTIEFAGRTHPHAIECWALDDGHRILFAQRKLGKQLESYHLGGTFDRIARYGLPYHDLLKIVESGIGPCDRVRYKQLRDSAGTRNYELIMVLTTISSGLIGVGLTFFMGAAKFLLVAALFPLVIMFFNRRH